MKSIKIYGLLLLLVAMSSAGCRKGEATDNSSYIRVLMTDSPDEPTASMVDPSLIPAGVLDMVNIDLSEMSVYLIPVSGQAQWFNLKLEKGIINLVGLNNGAEATLVPFMNMPAGDVTHLRFMLGKENWVSMNGEVKKLSAPENPLVEVHMTEPIRFAPGRRNTILIDFDTDKSVIMFRDRLILHPVVNVIN